MNNINDNFIYLDSKNDILYTLVKVIYDPYTYKTTINNFNLLKDVYDINLVDITPSFNEEEFNKLENYNFTNEIHQSLEQCF